MNIKIINACCDLGVHIDGASLGPKKLKEHIISNSKIDNIIDCECDCSDKSHNINDLEKNYDRIMKFSNQLYNNIIDNQNDSFIITVGGDHSIAVASTLADVKKNGDIGIIWCDAHVDYNTFETTITGNIHGLPLATINGLNKKLSTFHNNEFIDPKKTVVVGYRAEEDNQNLELNNIKNMGVTVFTTDDIKEYGVSNIMNKAFDIASSNGNNKVHISYDLDLIDPDVAPGVSIPELNGINLNETFDVVNEIRNKKDIISSFDLVEFNPLNDINNKTYDIATKILDNIIDLK